MSVIDIPFDTARTFVEPAASVLFFARLGDHTLRCYITRSALETYFGAPGGADAHAAGCLRAFDVNAPRIRAIARELIGRRAAGAQSVVLTADDVFRCVARLH